MKNIKGFVLCTFLILIIILITGGIMFLRKKTNNEAQEYIKKIINANSFSTEIKIYKKRNFASDKSDNILIEQNKKENFEHITTSSFDTNYYIYQDDYIFKIKDENIWFYKTDNYFSSYTEDKYAEHLNELLNILANKKYSYKNGKYISTKELNDVDKIVKEIKNIEDDEWYDADSKKIVVKYNTSKIELDVKENNIAKIRIKVEPDCTNIDENFCDKSYVLDFRFNDLNNIDGKLPDDVLSSLDKTNAKDWIGNYSNTITCPGGITMTSKIKLTNEFDWNHGKGWGVSLKVEPRCYDESFLYLDAKYKYENDKVIVFDNISEEKLYTFNYSSNKLELLGENGNILETFYKE